MAELMGDPRDPDAHDGAPIAADDVPTLVLDIAPVDTSAAVGGDAAAAREAAAHFAKGQAHFDRHESAEALKAFRAAAEADPKMSRAWLWISATEFEMNGGKHCEAEATLRVSKPPEEVVFSKLPEEVVCPITQGS